MLQLKGEDGTKHWLDLERGNRLFSLGTYTINLCPTLHQLSGTCHGQELREVPFSCVPGSAVSPRQPGYTSITSSVSELIAVRLLGNLKAYLKTE